MGGVLGTIGKVASGPMGWASLAGVGPEKAVGMGGASGGKGGKGGGAPSAPDFKAAAEAQAASSRETTDAQLRANRPNQTNAFGASSQWSQGPDGQWTQSTSLGGPLGQAAQGLEGQIAGQGPLGTGDQAREAGVRASYDQAKSRLDPHFAQAEEAQRSQLLNQGLDPGSQAYDTAAGNLSREKNDAYGSAERNAELTGSQIGAQTFAQNLQAQNNPYQQLGALGGFSQQAGFQNAGAAQPTQYLPAAMAGYSGALQGYAADQASKNSMMGGAAGLGGAAMLASDERLKTDIARGTLEAIPGVPFASWEWRDGSGRGFGVIAQDVEKVRPDLIGRRPDGMRMVDYAGLLKR